jgi:phosphoribosylanthranilate isomerase
LTRPEDVALCHSLGVDFTGFVFVPGSPRFLTPDAAAALPRGGSRRIGVFAGADLESIRKIARTAALDYIQLHGGEDPAFCRALGPERVIRAFWPQRCSPGALRDELECFAPVCAYFLFDAGKTGGGSGKTLDFQSLKGIVSPRPWLLAGGLGPDTLQAALHACAPDGVDCNSGLETAPGVKNHMLVRQAAAVVRGMSPE